MIRVLGLWFRGWGLGFGVEGLGSRLKAMIGSSSNLLIVTRPTHGKKDISPKGPEYVGLINPQNLHD